MLHLFQGGAMICCWFLGAKMVKSEYNLKNIWKSPKRNLTKLFVGEKMIQSDYNFKNICKYHKNNSIYNFAEKVNMYLKKEKHIWMMSDLFQKMV